MPLTDHHKKRTLMKRVVKPEPCIKQTIRLHIIHGNIGIQKEYRKIQAAYYTWKLTLPRKKTCQHANILHYQSSVWDVVFLK